MAYKFSKEQLNRMFVEDLGPHVKWTSDLSNKVLLVDFVDPELKLRVYLFNCTCPPGGRSLDEFKVQLIIEGQRRGERGHLDMSGGRHALVVGFATPLDTVEDGVYVMWDPFRHEEFAYSANLQCYLEPMLEAIATGNAVTCLKKGNKEEIVVAQKKNLPLAVCKRISLDSETARRLLENL